MIALDLNRLAAAYMIETGCTAAQARTAVTLAAAVALRQTGRADLADRWLEARRGSK